MTPLILLSWYVMIDQLLVVLLSKLFRLSIIFYSRVFSLGELSTWHKNISTQILSNKSLYSNSLIGSRCQWHKKVCGNWEKSAVFDWKPNFFCETLNLTRRLTIKSLAAHSTQNRPILLNFSQLFCVIDTDFLSMNYNTNFSIFLDLSHFFSSVSKYHKSFLIVLV